MHTCPEASLVEVKSLPFTPDPGQIMQLQSKWKHTSNKFNVSVPVSHAQLQIGSSKGGGFWG